METHLIQFSSVVVGKAHNPSILNPDFLALNEIVPKEWNWEVAETITTPPLALVRYANGVSITAEHNKLQVVDVSENPLPDKGRITLIARKYVETLPHVRYVAVGNNFQSVMEVDKPGGFLKCRFLKDGPWDDPSRPVEEAGIRLVYRVPDGKLVLSLDAGQAEKSDPPNQVAQSVVLVNGNFHRDCEGYPVKEQVLRYLGHAQADWIAYQELVPRILA